MSDIFDNPVDDPRDPGQRTPPAPKDLELPERLAWRAGYRQALRDLAQIDLHGGEITVNDERVPIPSSFGYGE